jgi:hypothetical protein
MTTTAQTHRGRAKRRGIARRTMAATLLARDRWVAIAYSPVDKQFGCSHNPTLEQAVTWALHNCGEVAGHCALAAVAKKGNCVALATRGIGEEYNGGSGKDHGSAMAAALRPLYGGQIKYSYCL